MFAAVAENLDWQVRPYNKKHGPVRAKVEDVFRALKHQSGYRKVRYRGIKNSGALWFARFALAKSISRKRKTRCDVLQGEAKATPCERA